MSLIAILLIVASAILHAGWNLLSKSRNPSSAFFLISTLAGALLLSPFLAMEYRVLFCVPARVWLLLGATGFFMAVYYGALAGAYRSGDMSIAYPLARSSPLIVVAVVAMALGRGEQVTYRCLAGIVIVVAGCFLLPMRQFGEFRARHYWNAACGLALLAAVGTAGYSIMDDEALRALRHTPGVGLSPLRAALFYAALETVSSAVWQLLAARVTPGGWTRLSSELRTGKFHPVMAGVAIWVAYALILVSLAFVRNVSYVVAFRQLSIPLGAALGVLVLKEPAPAPKIIGVAVIFLGLMLVAVG
jgi:drug/metabolite transporter (DMT)-like permease